MLQNFYKFNDVILELETGEKIPLSCYDRKISIEELASRINNPQNQFRQGLRGSVYDVPVEHENEVEDNSRDRNIDNINRNYR